MLRPVLRHFALLSCCACARAPSDWSVDLGSPEPLTRLVAAAALLDAAPDKAVTQALLAAGRHGDEELDAHLLAALDRQPAARELAVAVCRSRSENHPGRRLAAAFLARPDPTAAREVAALIVDPDVWRRGLLWPALRAQVQAGHLDDVTAPADPILRFAAWLTGRPGAAFPGDLATALRRAPESDLTAIFGRMIAADPPLLATVTGELSPLVDAQRRPWVVLVLDGLLDTPDERRAHQPALHFLTVHGTDAVPPLVERVRGDPVRASVACRALLACGPASRAVLPELADIAATTTHPGVRQALLDVIAFLRRQSAAGK